MAINIKSRKWETVCKACSAPASCLLPLRPKGFALLIAVIFMSVMLAFALMLGSLGYKQQVLASTSIESQAAFYVADSALECALYADQQLALFAFSASSNVPPALPAGLCGVTQASSIKSRIISIAPTPSQWVLRYTIEYADVKECADITVYKPTSGTTYIYSQGYDVLCSTLSVPGARFVSRGLFTYFTSSGP